MVLYRRISGSIIGFYIDFQIDTTHFPYHLGFSSIYNTGGDYGTDESIYNFTSPNYSKEKNEKGLQLKIRLKEFLELTEEEFMYKDL